MALVISDALMLESATKNRNILRIYDYWLERHGQNLFPSRQNIDPPSFSFALGWVSLIDVAPDGKFHYRLVSTNLTDLLGYEATGKFTSELPDVSARSYVSDFYLQTVNARAPLYDNDIHCYQGRYRPYEALALPLSSDGSQIDMLMVYRQVGKARSMDGVSRSVIPA